MMMSIKTHKIKRIRGRPRKIDDPFIEAIDQIIGRSIHQLLFWGFPLRSRRNRIGVAEWISLAAKNQLGRSDSNGLALGPDRVEQLYEFWLKTEKKKRTLIHQRWRYSKKSLYSRCPNKQAGLEELCNKLILNHGEWPTSKENEWFLHGDAELTPKAHADYLRNRINIVK